MSFSTNDIDLSSVEKAVAGLLDQAQKLIGYPYDKNAAQDPSVVLDYSFTANIKVDLKVDWQLPGGLVLRNITLQTAIQKTKQQPGEVFVSLSATAVIDNIVFTATAIIPRLDTLGNVDFVIILEIDGNLNTILPTSLVSSLTANGCDFPSAVSKLDPTLTQQLENDGTGISFATSASVWIHKESHGEFYLRSLQFDFASNITWDVTSKVQLQAVGLQVSVDYDNEKKDWAVVFDIGASLSIVGVDVDVSGRFVAADGTKLDLNVVAAKRSSIVPEDIVGQLLGDEERKHYTDQFKLSPELKYPADGESGIHSHVTFSRYATGWHFDCAKISLIWQLMAWRPFKQISFLVDSLQLDGLVRRDGKRQPPENSYVYQGSLTGLIRLGGARAQVIITYDSDSGKVFATCTFLDSTTISLQSIAKDPQLNAPVLSQRTLSDGHDLARAAAQFPVPQGVPVDLDWCSSNFWSSNRVCSVEFLGTEMTKFSLKADYELKWKITDQIELTEMGAFFEVEKPLANQDQSTIAGYAYGSFALNETVTLFLFVGGVSDAECSKFVVTLSTSYEPNAKVGKLSAQEILSNPKFIGDPVPINGWRLPCSFPEEDTPEKALTSLHAFLGARMKQTRDPDADTGYSTTLESFTARIVLEGKWPIVADFSLEEVSLSVIVKPSSPPPTTIFKTNYDVFAELSGTVSQALTAVGLSKYEVTFSINVKHKQNAATIFTASINAVLIGQAQAMIDLGTIFKMPFSGLEKVDVTEADSAKAIPDAFPAQPKDLLAIASAECLFTFKKPTISDSWAMASMYASVRQIKDWVILPGKLTVTDGKLSLLVTNPRSDSRQIAFAAEATLTIGNEFKLTAAVVAVNPGSKDGSIQFTLTGGNAQKIMTTLLRNDFTDKLPTETVFDPGYNFQLKVNCKRLESGSYTLKSVELSLNATVSWQLGSLTVQQLSLKANFADLDSLNPSKSVIIEGVLTIGELPVKISATLTNSTELLFKFIEATPPTSAVDVFIPGGLDSNGRLQAPDVTAASGFGDYKTKPVFDIEVVFLKASGADWKPSSLTLDLSSTTKWTLINELLWIKDLSFSLVLKNISSDNPTLSVQLAANFAWKNRKAPPDTKSLPTTLTATRKDLSILLKTNECALPDFLYIATGGLWDPPDALNFPLVTPQSLQLVLSWDDKTAKIIIIWNDWSVVRTLPKIASIKQPILQAGLYKENSGLSAKGEIKGTIVLLRVSVPISYDLPNGPFRVFGVDVKKAYDMVRKIWNALKNIADFAKRVKEVTQAIADVLADLATLAEALEEVAGIVAGTLIELGVDAVIVLAAIAAAFGNVPIKPPTPPPGPEPDPGNNYPPSKPSKPGSPYLILGGDALNAGAGPCYLIVYPKDGTGKPWAELDPKKLKVTQYGNPLTISDWAPSNSGWKSTYTRERTQRPTPVIIYYSGEPPLEASYISEVKTPPSSFSLQKSILSFEPNPVICISRSTLVFIPRDQYGDTLKGRDGRDGFLDPRRLTITVTNKLPGGSEPVYDKKKGFISKNNCLLLSFVIKEPGSYIATISDHYAISKRDFGFVVIDPYQCLVWGPGACSSKPGNVVEFWVKLRQGDGSDYFPPADSPIKIDVLVEAGSDILLVKQLPYAIQAVNASYSAPADGVNYTLELSINGVALAGGAIPMRARSSEPHVDASAVTLDLWSMNNIISPDLVPGGEGPIAQDDNIGGQIVLYERIGKDEYYRWRQARSGVFKFQWPENVEGPKLEEQPDGVYLISAKAGKMGSESSMSVTAAESESAAHCRGSPRPVNIQPRRQLSQVVAYGTGLCSGYDEEGVIRIKGYDQYGARWPVNVKTDCQITINHKNKQISWAADDQDQTAIIFQKPARSVDDTYMVTIGPTTAFLEFPEDVRLVSLADRATSDPTRSFVQWKSLKKQAVSVAKIFISDQLGQQWREGGNDLVVQGVKKTAPPVTPISIIDNDDGTYTLKFILPEEAFAGHGTAPVAGDFPQLSITLGGVPIIGSPFSFPLSDRQMLHTHIVEDDYYAANGNEEKTFTLVCTDKHGSITDLGLHSYGAFLTLANSELGKLEPFIDCVSENKDGKILIKYTVPDGADKAYKLHIWVNNEEIQDKPAVISTSSHVALKASCS